MKTGKSTVNEDDEILITEAIQQSVLLLIDAYAKSNKRNKIPKIFTLDDYLFQSKQPDRTEMIEDEDNDGQLIPNPAFGKYVIKETSMNRIMKDAQRSLNLKFDLCTRSTRKTFASLVAVFYNKHTTNSTGIEMAQIMLRHSSQRHTKRYMTISKQQTAAIRHDISDWLLGKSDVNKITF